MVRPEGGEHPTRDTGDINFSVTGTWRGTDEHRDAISIKVGEVFPRCPSCLRLITWIYVTE